MFKKISLSLVLLLITAGAIAQPITFDKSKIDAHLWQMIQAELEQNTATTETDNQLVYRVIAEKFENNTTCFTTHFLSLRQMATMSQKPETIQLHASRKMQLLDNEANALCGIDALQNGNLRNTRYLGEGVIIGIIDTGIDWSHLAFRANDTTKSRIISIWDQSLQKQGAEKTPFNNNAVLNCCNYGVEYTKSQIEAAINNTQNLTIRHHDSVGHGSLVASIAAGLGDSLNRYTGAAPAAEIIMIAGDLEDASVLDALQYLDKKASAANKPLVINMSFGANYGPHNGTAIVSRAVDNITLSKPGRIAVSAAGNSGNKKHHQGGFIQNSNSKTFTFTVNNYNLRPDTNYFAITIWLPNNQSLFGKITSPSGVEYTISPAQVAVTGSNQSSGKIQLQNSIYLGQRYIDLLVSGNQITNKPATGLWTFEISNNSPGNDSIAFNAWIWNYTMGLAFDNGDSKNTVVYPADANGAIAVAAYNSRTRWSNIAHESRTSFATVDDRSDTLANFSSIGPRVDGVMKPEISAPGDRVIGALAKTNNTNPIYICPNQSYISGSGTSFASPIVAGAIAQLLATNHALTQLQVKNLIIQNALEDDYTGNALPNSYWGYGKLDAYKTMIHSFDPSAIANREIIAHDTWSTRTGGKQQVVLSKKAVKFRPSFEGHVEGILFHLDSNNVGLNQRLRLWIVSDSLNKPNRAIGGPYDVNTNKLWKHTWNYFDLEDTSVKLNANLNYYVVFEPIGNVGLGLFADDDGASGNSLSYENGNWTIINDQDLRIRPIVASTYLQPLSIEFEWANCSLNNQKADLNWVSYSEWEMDFFEVQHVPLINLNNDFKTIAQVKAIGNSNSPQTYNLLTPKLPFGAQLFRLKAISLDGTAQYSSILQLDNTFNDVFQLNTAVIGNSLEIKLLVDTKQDIDIQLFDSKGALIAQKQIKDYRANLEQVNYLAMQGCANGVYFVKIKGLSFEKSEKFLFLHQ